MEGFAIAQDILANNLVFTRVGKCPADGATRAHIKQPSGSYFIAARFQPPNTRAERTRAAMRPADIFLYAALSGVGGAGRIHQR